MVNLANVIAFMLPLCMAVKNTPHGEVLLKIIEALGVHLGVHYSSATSSFYRTKTF